MSVNIKSKFYYIHHGHLVDIPEQLRGNLMYKEIFASFTDDMGSYFKMTCKRPVISHTCAFYFQNLIEEDLTMLRLLSIKLSPRKPTRFIPEDKDTIYVSFDK